MASTNTSVDPLHALFIDEDGRLESIATALEAHPGPIESIRVESLAEAVTVTDEQWVDCVVLLDAPATDELAAVDGVEQVETVRERLPGIPIAIYSVLGEHETVRRAHEAGVKITSATPDEARLVYRQLRAAAGMERDTKTPDEILQSLMAHYPHQLYLKDDVGRFAAVSIGTAAEYELDREGMVGLTDLDVLDAYGDETYSREQQLLESHDRIVERLDNWVDRTGRERWVAVTKAPRYDAEGDSVGIVGSSRGVTKEKRKEQMVRELHAVGRELVRAQSKHEIGQAVMAMASDIPVFSHIQVVLSEDGSLDPLSDREIAAEETLFGRYEARFRTVVESREPEYVTADGSTVDNPEWASDLETAVLPLGGHGALGLAADAGTFTDFGIDLANILASNLEAALDRTERERELERQNQHLEEFASIVSHDLRNPLNVASASTELLAEDVDSPQIDRITGALERMEQLIEALLTLARKGQVVGDTEFVSVAGAARTAWQVVDAPVANLQVDSSGLVTADENRLVELFENLFRNSVEHGSETVSVTVGMRDDNSGFYVADDGPGIDPEVQGQLFEMGFSGADGTGYGLYIVSTITDAHSWDVQAGESDAGGARFDVMGATRVDSLDEV